MAFLISHARMAAFKARLLAAKVKAQGVGRLAGKHITRRLEPRILVATVAVLALGLWRRLWRIYPHIVAAAAAILGVGVALLTRARGDHRPASTERLDRSHEAFDLAVSAGVAVSRSRMAARRIEPRAFVGTIVLLATLLIFGVLPLVQKRPPNHTTLYVFSATILPLSFVYVVHQNWGLIRSVWQHPLGKIFYGLVVPIMVILSKIWTDQQIRSLTDSNPSLFPSAQQAIIVLNIIIFALFGIGLLISIFMTTKIIWLIIKNMTASTVGYLSSTIDIVLRPMRLSIGYRPSSASWLTDFSGFAAYLWGLFFIALMLSFFDTRFTGSFLNTDFVGFGGKPINLTEELLLFSSFIRNDLWLAGSDRVVCTNLRPDTLVSPFNTRDPTPNEVLLAQPIITGPDRSGRSYTYHVVACSKPRAPLWH
jgi:hypothetical protein